MSVAAEQEHLLVQEQHTTNNTAPTRAKAQPAYDPMYKDKSILDEASCWSMLFFNWCSPFMRVSLTAMAPRNAHANFICR